MTSPRRDRVLILAVTLVLSGLVAGVRADEPNDVSTSPEHPPRSAEFRAIIAEAVRESAAMQYEEARSLFLRAHALQPSARTHRGIGVTEFELRNYAASVEHLDAALRSTVRPLEGALRTEVEELLERARRFVGRLTIETQPRASELRLDRAPLALTSGEVLTLDIGTHVLEAVAPGYAPEERHVNVQSDQLNKVSIVFSRPLPSEQRDAEPVRESKSRWYRSPWLWTAVGAVVAGSVTAGLVISQHSGGRRVASPHRGSVDSLVAP